MSSLRAQYDADVSRVTPRVRPVRPSVTEADLAPLPVAVQRYLRFAGVVGRAHVRTVRARMHGRIRSGPRARWMPFRAIQVDRFDDPARLFYFDASMFGMPIRGYHRYVGPSATMLVKLLGLFPVARAGGPAMTKAETVTLFNDMCLLAPAALLSPMIQWEGGDDRSVSASFTNAGHTIRASLHFDASDALVNFVSDDRLREAADGQPAHLVRWSTPMTDVCDFHGVRLAARGDARWHEPSGEFAYIELTIDDVRYDE